MSLSVHSYMPLSLSSGVCIVADITLLLVNCFFMIDVVHLLQFDYGGIHSSTLLLSTPSGQIITEIGERAFSCN